MSGTRSGRRRDRATVLRRRRIVAGGIAVLALVGVTAGCVALASILTRPGADASAQSAATPSASSPAPTLSAAQALLAGTADPAACAVTLAGDGIALAPVLERDGTLFGHLPIPDREGHVFAGWYPSPDDAATGLPAARVNGSRVVDCPSRELTLHASWRTAADSAAEATRVPILMYHQFTENPKGESGSLRGNYAYIGDFEEHIRHIAQTGFYLPTWDELAAFIDGRISLPARSVIVTDDDAHETWLRLAVPIVERHRVLTTSFVITKWRTEPSPGTYVLQRSHTDSMHEAGANGRGRMVNWTPAEIAADLEKSAAILGAKEVVAYPFGHYDERTKEGMRLAGFELGRSIEPGFVVRGTDKLALPVVRIDYGTTLADLVARIG